MKHLANMGKAGFLVSVGDFRAFSPSRNLCRKHETIHQLNMLDVLTGNIKLKTVSKELGINGRGFVEKSLETYEIEPRGETE